MLTKTLGILDLVAAFIFILSISGQFMPHFITIIAGLYLLIKGIMFALLADFASFIDIACGIIILVSIWVNIPVLLSVIALLFLIQKGIFSLAS